MLYYRSFFKLSKTLIRIFEVQESRKKELKFVQVKGFEFISYYYAQSSEYYSSAERNRTFFSQGFNAFITCNVHIKGFFIDLSNKKPPQKCMFP